MNGKVKFNFRGLKFWFKCDIINGISIEWFW